VDVKNEIAPYNMYKAGIECDSTILSIDFKVSRAPNFRFIVVIYQHEAWHSTPPAFLASEARTISRRACNKGSRLSKSFLFPFSKTSLNLVPSISNMVTPIAKLGSAVILAAIATIMVLTRVVISTWSCRRVREPEFSAFSTLLTQAIELAAETQRFRREVDEDMTTGRIIRTADLAVLSEANEWDTSIRICLTAWEDLLQLDVCTSDEESGKGVGMDEERRKELLGTMAARCREGMARRKELGPQLKHMHLESISR
jgi:hypothetical protein